MHSLPFFKGKHLGLLRSWVLFVILSLQYAIKIDEYSKCNIRSRDEAGFFFLFLVLNFHKTHRNGNIK